MKRAVKPITEAQIRRLVARNVKRLRVEQGLTHEELAGLTGRSVRYVQRLERAEVNATLDVLGQLSRALRVDILELVEKR